MRIPTFHQFERQAAVISRQFDEMRHLQQQMSSGKKITAASDDPVLANQIEETQTFIEELNGYYRNGVLVQNRCQYYQTAMQGALNSMTNLNSDLLRVSTGVLSPEDAIIIANQMQGELTNILSIANTQDTNGSFIFSGYNTSTQPYAQTGGSYVYQGSYEATMIDIGPSSQSTYNESGYSVFSNILTGNGTFTATASAGNTGSANTTPGSISNRTAYVPDTYTISIVTNGSGQKAYQVVGTASGQLIPPLPATIPTNAPAYAPGPGGLDLNFNGITINLGSGANVGDSFVLQPSTPQNAFDTIQNVINTLLNPPTNQGQLNQQLSQANIAFTQIFNSFNTYQTQLGQRTANINAQINLNQEAIVDQQVTLDDLESSDMAAVMSKLAQQSLALQATQEGYLKIQETFSQLLKI